MGNRDLAEKIYEELNKKGGVINRFSFEEREPEIGAYISLVWGDGSDCECIYDGLDKSILPLPTYWYYIKNQNELTLPQQTFCGSCNREIDAMDKHVGLCDECGYELAK